MNERMNEWIMILSGLWKAVVIAQSGIIPALRKWSQDNYENLH